MEQWKSDTLYVIWDDNYKIEKIRGVQVQKLDGYRVLIKGDKNPW